MPCLFHACVKCLLSKTEVLYHGVTEKGFEIEAVDKVDERNESGFINTIVCWENTIQKQEERKCSSCFFM